MDIFVTFTSINGTHIKNCNILKGYVFVSYAVLDIHLKIYTNVMGYLSVLGTLSLIMQYVNKKLGTTVKYGQHI